MMKVYSAGLLIYRQTGGELEVFIVHNGGPFWAKKDAGVWSLPKGEIDDDQPPLETAKREFKEETGFEPPDGPFIELGEVDYPRGHKAVMAWAAKGNYEADKLVSNNFEMEWPPRSGRQQAFPEVDRGGWFNLSQAAKKLFPPNVAFLERLASELGIEFNPPAEAEQASLF